MKIIPKPEPGEYPDYAEMYLKLLPTDGLVLQHLAENFRMVKDFIYALPPDIRAFPAIVVTPSSIRQLAKIFLI